MADLCDAKELCLVVMTISRPVPSVLNEQSSRNRGRLRRRGYSLISAQDDHTEGSSGDQSLADSCLGISAKDVVFRWLHSTRITSLSRSVRQAEIERRNRVDRLVNGSV